MRGRDRYRSSTRRAHRAGHRGDNGYAVMVMEAYAELGDGSFDRFTDLRGHQLSIMFSRGFA
ncbi:MAG: hypothetical protein LC808_27755 [Actinobacteria bacterium]|nr:hypothetical protein [Actinomycetota bacterium]